MRRQVINTAQKFLTIDYPGRTFQIVNIELFLIKHQPEAVIDFLKTLKIQYDRRLKRALNKNTSDPVIHDLVGKRFRIKMAINTIRNGIGIKTA